MELKDQNGKVVATVTAATTKDPGCKSGVWIELSTENKTKPTICLIEREKDFYLGFYRDTNKTTVGCDLAIAFGTKGPEVQVVKEGQVEIFTLFDILKKLSAT